MSSSPQQLAAQGQVGGTRDRARGGAIPLAIRLMQREQQACVAVVDQGIGIAEEAQAYVFERYYRASHGDAHQISGAGIGLSVVKEIVALHGGSVSVQSSEGEGSTFTICLPLLEAVPHP